MFNVGESAFVLKPLALRYVPPPPHDAPGTHPRLDTEIGKRTLTGHLHPEAALKASVTRGFDQFEQRVTRGFDQFEQLHDLRLRDDDGPETRAR